MSAISPISGSAEEIRVNYLKLLVTQLRNQNPLEPMDNNEMASQLAQISQLEQLANLNNTFERALVAAQINQATAMINKEVTFIPRGQTDALAGTVEAVGIIDGEVLLKVGNYGVGLDEVQTIMD